MNIYSVEEIVNEFLELFPSYDVLQRMPTLEKYIKEALFKSLSDDLKFYYSGQEVKVAHGEGDLPIMLDRLLNVYTVIGEVAVPVSHRKVGNKLQVFETCSVVYINYYGQEANPCAYSIYQKDYAIYYAMNKLLEDDVYRGIELNRDFYGLINSKLDTNKRALLRQPKLSWDEMANLIFIQRYGKYYSVTNAPLKVFQ